MRREEQEIARCVRTAVPRLFQVALATVSVVFCGAGMCCGVGEPELVARSAAAECDYYSCALAVDGEVSSTVLYASSKTELETVRIEPPGLAEVEATGIELLIRPRAEGEGELSVTSNDSGGWRVPIRTVARAVTSVVPAVSFPSYPPGRPQLYAGSKLRVRAEHRDASGERLLGHGFETWTVTGGTLVEPEVDPLVDRFIDRALVRDVVADGAALLSVSARSDGTPLELDVVPTGGTMGFRLEYSSSVETPLEISLATYGRVVAKVTPYTADGRYIHGEPSTAPLAADIPDSTIATATVDHSQRAVIIDGRAPGSTTLSVSIDGVTRRFQVSVY